MGFGSGRLITGRALRVGADRVTARSPPGVRFILRVDMGAGLDRKTGSRQTGFGQIFGPIKVHAETQLSNKRVPSGAKSWRSEPPFGG